MKLSIVFLLSASIASNTAQATSSLRGRSLEVDELFQEHRKLCQGEHECCGTDCGDCCQGHYCQPFTYKCVEDSRRLEDPYMINN